jgi:hypothetical protein
VELIACRVIEFAFRAPAGTEPCAGEGELVFGLTKHGATLANASGGVNRQVLSASGAGLAADTGVYSSSRGLENQVIRDVRFEPIQDPTACRWLDGVYPSRPAGSIQGGRLIRFR